MIEWKNNCELWIEDTYYGTVPTIITIDDAEIKISDYVSGLLKQELWNNLMEMVPAFTMLSERTEPGNGFLRCERLTVVWDEDSWQVYYDELHLTGFGTFESLIEYSRKFIKDLV